MTKYPQNTIAASAQVTGSRHALPDRRSRAVHRMPADIDVVPPPEHPRLAGGTPPARP